FQFHGYHSPTLRYRRRPHSGLLGRRLNNHVTALGAGHTAPDKNEVALFIHTHDLQVLHRRSRIAQMARHLFALEHMSRRLVLAYGARRTMCLRVAMRGALSLEVVTL